jgi:hypothetical protein
MAAEQKTEMDGCPEVHPQRANPMARHGTNMQPIVAIADLDEARLQERALLFIWVNWAIQARQSEIELRKLLSTLGTDSLNWQAITYRVDISEGEGEVFDALAKWIGAEPIDRGNLIDGGCGALLWLRSGLIRASVVGALNHSQEQLLAITHGVFDPEK